MLSLGDFSPQLGFAMKSVKSKNELLKYWINTYDFVTLYLDKAGSHLSKLVLDPYFPELVTQNIIRATVLFDNISGVCGNYRCIYIRWHHVRPHKR